MHKLSLALSNRVKTSRYVSLTQKPKVDGVFYAGFEICLPNFAIDRDNFPFWITEYITEGQGEINLRGQHARLSPGSTICYGPGVAIHFHNELRSPFHKYFLCHTGEQFPKSWRQAGLAPGTVFQLAGGAPFHEVMDQLLHDGEHGVSEAAATLTALELILLAFIRESQQQVNEENITGSARVYHLAKQVMLQEFCEINSLAELAERTGYGPEYLCRIFRKYHSESPYQALLRMKMNEAFRLLKEGRIRVMDIARQVGFEDPLHFSRVFRKIMGFPPSVVNGR